jgi:hypothetical protein
MLQYRREMLGGGIPMPAVSASMPMPNYESYMVSSLIQSLYSLFSHMEELLVGD